MIKVQISSDCRVSLYIPESMRAATDIVVTAQNQSAPALIYDIDVEIGSSRARGVISSPMTDNPGIYRIIMHGTVDGLKQVAYLHNAVHVYLPDMNGNAPDDDTDAPSWIVNSLEGGETDKAPSVATVADAIGDQYVVDEMLIIE